MSTAQHLSSTEVDHESDLYRATCSCGWQSTWVPWQDYDVVRRAWWRHTGKGPRR